MCSSIGFYKGKYIHLRKNLNLTYNARAVEEAECIEN